MCSSDLKTIGAALGKGAAVYACAGAMPFSEAVTVSKAVTLYAQGVADAILEGRANAVNEVVQAARGGDDGDEFVEVNAEA